MSIFFSIRANVWSRLEDELSDLGLYYPVNNNWVHHQHLNEKFDRLTIGYVADNNITVTNEILVNHIHGSIDGDEITVASNGLARHNGTYFKDYGDILASVSIDTILDAIVQPISQ